MKTLILDTSSNERIIVGLEIDGKEFINTKKISPRSSQIILPMIDELLKARSLEPKDINRIKINTGPGSFTGLRVGIAIANSLSFILKIPINEKKVGEIIEPIYK